MSNLDVQIRHFYIYEFCVIIQIYYLSYQNRVYMQRKHHFFERQWQRGVDEVIIQAVAKKIPNHLRTELLCVAVSRRFIKQLKQTCICHLDLSPNQLLVLIIDKAKLVTAYKGFYPQQSALIQANLEKIMLWL
jgi:hypothetical protein